jgi:hypothetical protein
MDDGSLSRVVSQVSVVDGYNLSCYPALIFCRELIDFCREFIDPFQLAFDGGNSLLVKRLRFVRLAHTEFNSRMQA